MFCDDKRAGYFNSPKVRAEYSERFLSGDRYLYVSLSGSSAKELPSYAELDDADNGIVRNSTLSSLPQ